MALKVNREGFQVSETQRECTSCGEVFLITSKTVTLCKPCNSLRVKCQSPEMKAYRRAKARAKERGVDFDLTPEDIIIPETCPILGIPLKVFFGRSGGTKESPALDRIDNSKGYIKGNVMIISHLANMMKSSATPKELLQFANWVLLTYNDTPVKE